MLVNDKNIKLSKLTDKFRKLDLDGQIHLFDNFQKKYYLLKVEISGKLIDVVKNIESSCMIVFNVGSGLTHTLFIDKDIDKRWNYVNNDDTFNEFKFEFQKFYIIEIYPKPEIPEKKEFNKLVYDYKI